MRSPLGSVAAVVVLSCLGALTSTAAVAQALSSFNLPAQPLADSLRAVAGQTNSNILFDKNLVSGLSAKPLKANLGMQDALTRLLSGTGLTYRYLDDHTVTIVSVSSSKDQGNAAAKPGPNNPPSDTSKLRVAQVDQGVPSSPSSVEKDNNQPPRGKPEQLEEVVVTGSRIPTTSKEGAQEVRIYTKEQIDQSGQSTIADFLSTLPDVSMSSIDSAAFGNYADQTTVQLHGLPQGTTLVLLNGRRVEINNYGFFDLNNIPLSAVERVEVIPTGSSAIYGADSLAGAVNIILRRNFDGFEASTKYGRSAGLGESNSSAAWGMSTQRGSVSIVGSFQDRGELLGSQRSITAAPNNVQAAFGLANECHPGTIYSLTGSNLPGLSSPMAAIPSGISGKPTISDFTSTAGTQNKCGYYMDNDIFAPLHRTGVLASAHYDVSEHITVFSEVMVSHEDINSRVDDLFKLYGAYGDTVPGSNAFNPFGEDVGISYSYPGLAYNYRRTTTFSRPLIGVRGPMLGDWTYEVVAFISQDNSRVTQNNNYNQANVQAALASSDPATALNPFASGAPASPTLLTSLFAAPPVVPRFDSRNVTTEATLSGPLLKLPSGTVQAVVGAESDDSKIHTESQDVGSSSPPVTNRRSAYSIFTEERVPLWADHSNSAGGDRLALTLAGRFDHTNDYGNKSTGQGGLEWRPTESLLIRGGYAMSYEAPQLTQLDGAPSTYTSGGYSDPFRDNEVVTNILVLSGPNPALKPERGNSKQIGIVYSSKTLTGLESSITYWAINISNYINIPSPQDLIDYPNLFPGLVTRAPPSAQDVRNGEPGPITSIADVYANFGNLDVAGLDFDLRYALHIGVGELTPSLSITETTRYKRALQPSLPIVSYLSQASLDGFAPRWKGIAALNWKAGPYAATVDGRYVGRYADYQDYLPNTNELGNFWLYDANFRYAVGHNLARNDSWLAGTYLELGAVNLLNRLPQLSNSFGGFDSAEADIRGRFLYAQLGVKF